MLHASHKHQTPSDHQTITSPSSTMSQLKKRSVAVSFIFQFPKDDTTNTRPKVALFKRSDKVRTYQFVAII
jgi:hypothetical protein